ncbi:hypothetical protein BY996DRAFT_6862668 [Phakopsora pachyrhizi]|nr:hypothetical protein BY996DRAFT_6862668 [Phakopsora pachyrhizi]
MQFVKFLGAHWVIFFSFFMGWGIFSLILKLMHSYYPCWGRSVIRFFFFFTAVTYFSVIEVISFCLLKMSF